MSGSKDDPFLESVADCPVCLDLNKDYLRRQWRRFGRLYATDAPYSFTLNLLSESLRSKHCDGCAVISEAAQRIKDESGLDFRNAILEFLDDERKGLSLTLTMLHPLHTGPGDWEKVQASPDLRSKVYTGPSKRFPEKPWVHKISSPRYEICSRVERESGSPNVTEKARWSGILPRPARCGDTGSDEAISWTHSKLEDCAADHLNCSRKETSWGLPTRVLDLGETDELTSDVKVYITNQEQADYVCLSHCWGTEHGYRPLMTVHETLPGFQKGIPYEKLPQTFQDAVVFTRKLGYRYLWIDSLCIIQDDGDDWLREAGAMASIYEHAVLTLSSASSSDSSGGLFRSTTPEIPLTAGDKHPEDLALRRFADPAFLKYSKRESASDIFESKETSPLFQRAWVFQERILSRRVLYFTPFELVFECRDSNETESGWSWIDSNPKHGFTSVYDEKISGRSLSTLWHQLVGKFTQLKLSMERDTLPAMAGVAQRFLLQGQNTDHNNYFAGLWQETFVEDLLWKVSSDRHRRVPRVNPGIPSWSWAQSDAPKSYDQHTTLTRLCQLEHATCTPRRPAGTALTSVESGYAVLSGYLLAAKHTSTGIVIEHNPRVSHIPDSDYPWSEEGQGMIRDGEKVFLLPIAVSPRMEDDISVHAIVLRPNTNGDGSFTRIGVHDISIHHLRNHHYIFEDTDVYLDVCRNLVSYGESLLGKDGKYQEVEGSGQPLYLASDAGKEFSHFRSKAWELHLFLYGSKPTITIDEFYGRMHLDALKSELVAEHTRIDEWRQRKERGEGQLHQRVLIGIV